MSPVLAATLSGRASVEIAELRPPLLDEHLIGDHEHDDLTAAVEREVPLVTGDPERFAELQRMLVAGGPSLDLHAACRERVRAEVEHQRTHDGWVSYMSGVPPELYGFRLLLAPAPVREPAREHRSLPELDALLEPQRRAESIDRLNRIFDELYPRISPGSSLAEVSSLLVPSREALQQACALEVDDPLLRAIAFQAREMLGASGAKMRSAGTYYATHPLMVASLAGALAPSAPAEERRKAALVAVLHDVWEEGERIRRPDDLTAALDLPLSLAIAPFLLDPPYTLTEMETPLFEAPARGPWWFNGFKVWAAFQECLARCPIALQIAELADRLDNLAEPVAPPQEPERRASFVAWMLAKNEAMIDAVVETRPELGAAQAAMTILSTRAQDDLHFSGEHEQRFFRARVEGARRLFRAVRRVHLPQIGDYYRPYFRYLDVDWEAP